MAVGYASDPSGFAYIAIEVDGIKAATSRSWFNIYDGLQPLSINTIQQLDAGQNVTITWTSEGGAYLYGDSAIYNHWTGTYLQSGTAAPPKCDYTGQTFEYPGM